MPVAYLLHAHLFPLIKPSSHYTLLTFLKGIFSQLPSGVDQRQTLVDEISGVLPKNNLKKNSSMANNIILNFVV